MPMDTLSDKKKLNNIYYNQNAPWAVWENNE
jgi:hypothetical protein